MKRLAPVLSVLLISCADQQPATPVNYKILEFKGGDMINVYVKDTAAVRQANADLLSKYKSETGFMTINYFDDSTVAHTYFDKQFDQTVSEKVKDTLAKHYIGEYSKNPHTGFERLSVGPR